MVISANPAPTCGHSGHGGHGGHAPKPKKGKGKGKSDNPCSSPDYSHLAEEDLRKHPSLQRPRAILTPSTHYVSLGLGPYDMRPDFLPFDLQELYGKISVARARKVPLSVIDLSGLDMSQRDSPILFEILSQPPAWFLNPSSHARRKWALPSAGAAEGESTKIAYTRLASSEAVLPPAFHPDDIEFPIRRIEANASNITSDSLHALTTFVRGNATMTELVIPSNQIAAYSAIPLATFASSMRWTNIRVLDLGRNAMAPTTLCAFLKNLDSPNLRTLGIQGVVASIESQKDRIEVAHAVAAFLRPRVSASETNREGTKPTLACPRLERFYLNDNDFSWHGIQIIAAAVVGLPVCEDVHKTEIVKLEDSQPRLVASARAAAAKPSAERYKAAPNRVLTTVAMPVPVDTAALPASSLFSAFMPPEVFAEYERSANDALEGREKAEREYRKLHKSEEDGMMSLITRKNFQDLVSQRLNENSYSRSERRIGATQLLRAARILGCEVREADASKDADTAPSARSDDGVADNEDGEDDWHDEDFSSDAQSEAASETQDVIATRTADKPFPFFRLPVEIRLHVLRQLPYVNSLSLCEFDRVLRFSCDRRTIGYGSTSQIGAPDAYTFARYLKNGGVPLLPSPSPLAAAPFSFAEAYANFSTPRDWPAEVLDFSSNPPEDLHGGDCHCGAEAPCDDPWRIELDPEDEEEKRRRERMKKARLERNKKAALAAARVDFLKLKKEMKIKESGAASSGAGRKVASAARRHKTGGFGVGNSSTSSHARRPSKTSSGKSSSTASSVIPGSGAGIAATTGIGGASALFSNGASLTGFFPFNYNAASAAAASTAPPAAAATSTGTAAASSTTAPATATTATSSTAPMSRAASNTSARGAFNTASSSTPTPSRTASTTAPATNGNTGANGNRSSAPAAGAGTASDVRNAATGEHVHVNCHHQHILYTPSAAKCAFLEVTGVDTAAFSNVR